MRLGQSLNAPILSLDALWQEFAADDDVDGFRNRVWRAHQADRWISDGTFAHATLDLRLPRATRIIWLDRAKIVCTARSLLRLFEQQTEHRLRDLPTVLAFNHSFERKTRPCIEAMRLALAPNVPLIRLTTDAEIARYLGSTEVTLTPTSCGSAKSEIASALESLLGVGASPLAAGASPL